LNYFLRQLQEIRQGGILAVVDKLISLKLRSTSCLILLVNAIWAIPAVWCMRKLRPWFLIRVGTLRSERIGHFAADGGLQWIELAGQPTNQVDIYWLPKQTSNHQWDKMIRRNFKVAWPVYSLDRWNAIIPGGEVHQRPSTSTDSRDIRGLLYRTENILEFLPEEESIAKNWLQAHGWKEGQPFVCLLVRDFAYLNSESTLKQKWDYHNYRDTNIATCIPAMEWLADQGIWVLRMGKVMNKPMMTNHSRIIDYAFCNDKSDFLDIWLFANCTLCISTGSGPDAVSQIYRRPILMLNLLPICGLWSWCETTTVPKHLIWEDSGKELSLMEHLENSYGSREDYYRNKIKAVDLNEEEIMEAVRETWAHLHGQWKPKSGDEKRQTEFLRQLKVFYDSSKYQGFIHPKARLADSFLRNNTQFIKS